MYILYTVVLYSTTCNLCVHVYHYKLKGGKMTVDSNVNEENLFDFQRYGRIFVTVTLSILGKM